MKNKRFAFSLVEITVALMIIAVLASLLLTAVQSSRDSARRTQCSSMIRQVGLALQLAESHHRSLPSGSQGYSLGQFRPGPLVAILPYLERNDNFERKEIFEECAAPFDSRNRSLPILCPSDGVDSGTNVRFSSGSSIGFHRDFVGLQEESGNGAFPGGAPLKLSEFIDGLSNTAGISERPIGRDGIRSIMSILGNHLPWQGISTKQVSQLQGFVPSEYLFQAGRSMLHGVPKHLSYNHVMNPNSIQVDSLFCNETCGNCYLGRIAARSNHTGGVNVAFMDGRTQFVSSSITTTVWEAIGSRAGNEPINHFE